MTEFVHVKGFKELQAFLDALPKKIEANIMRSALRAGAREVLEKAKSNLSSIGSVKSGALRDSLRISTGIKKGVVTAKLKSGGDPANTAIWVEYGTAAHYIKVSDKDRPTRTKRNGTVKMVSMKTTNKMIASGSLVINGRFVGESVHHPGARPKPFLRPALDSSAGDVLRAVGESIKRRLTKQGLDVSGVDIEIEEGTS